ncbi:MAG TPA: aspartate ammonia-lyase [Candidatus Baltobacteraceae bacterium]|nr:aspartate ammonia-lyase [Candidatus Baltobacteraceae bacterium]
MASRTEHDVLGDVKVDSGAYYGSETQRSINNFQISPTRMPNELIYALANVKIAAAMTNVRLGKLDKKRGDAIVRAAKEVVAGKLDDQFVVGVFQAGAGTSTNMNVNEVIANRAIELLHGKRGDYKIVHPNDHVNMSQSTNDAFHSAIRIATHISIKERLIPSIRGLNQALSKKSSEFAKVLKVGRTHLQDAVPMSLGQEFSAFATAMFVEMERMELANKELKYLPLGGTALGTGINAPKGYRQMCIREINRITGCKFDNAKNFFYEIPDQTTEAFVSGAIRNVAVALNKIANDLRLLTSGPSTGFSDITLPEIQPGSSIMPGKINPSIPEMVNMVCFEVMGNDAAVSNAAQNGQLQLNVFTPLIVYKLLYSIEILSNAMDTLSTRCIRGIKANEKVLKGRIEHDMSIATALSPYIGYARAAEIARKSYLTGKTVRQICLEERVMSREKLDRLLDPKNLI